MLYLLYPFGCALIYPVATLLLKQVMGEAGGPWRVTFVANLTMGLLFLPMLLLAHTITPAAVWWQPLLGGLSYFVGQIFTFLSLNKGDASVATPILGTKVIFVALLTVVLMQQGVPLSWWLAAGLTSVALLFLSIKREKPSQTHHHGATVVSAILGAFCFAITDIFTQKYSPLWSFQVFAPTMFGLAALLSFTLIPFFGRHSRRPPVGGGGMTGKVWVLLLVGSALLAFQTLGMCYVLSIYGRATAVNVVYNARGIFSVLLVWCVGHWFANQEREVGRQIMTWRLIGAVLLLSAIGLIIAGR